MSILFNIQSFPKLHTGNFSRTEHPAVEIYISELEFGVLGLPQLQLRFFNLSPAPTFRQFWLRPKNRLLNPARKTIINSVVT